MFIVIEIVFISFEITKSGKEAFSSSHRLRPVSYTHLDVYKRQVGKVARTSARVQLQGTTSAGAPAR